MSSREPTAEQIEEIKRLREWAEEQAEDERHAAEMHEHAGPAIGSTATPAAIERMRRDAARFDLIAQLATAALSASPPETDGEAIVEIPASEVQAGWEAVLAGPDDPWRTVTAVVPTGRASRVLQFAHPDGTDCADEFADDALVTVRRTARPEADGERIERTIEAVDSDTNTRFKVTTELTEAGVERLRKELDAYAAVRLDVVDALVFLHHLQRHGLTVRPQESGKA